MAQSRAAANRRLDLPLPKGPHWWESARWKAFAASVEALGAPVPPSSRSAARARDSPASIPELPPEVAQSDSCQIAESDVGTGEQEVEIEPRQSLVDVGTTDQDRLRMEQAHLNSQISKLSDMRDRVRTDLIDLRGQVARLGDLRDRLLAEVAPLRAEVSDLSLKKQEMATLGSEIQTLRRRKYSLEREILDELRRSIDNPANPRSRGRRFDDS